MSLQSKKVLEFFIWGIITFSSLLSYNVLAYTDVRESVVIQSTGGEYVNFKHLIKGKATYLKLWASWCQDCLKQMPHMQETYEKYGDNVNVIGVNVWINESLPSIEKVVEDNNITFPMYIDKSGQLAQSFDLIGTPLHVLIDTNGNVVHKGHEVNKDLEQKLLFLATGEVIEHTTVIEKNLSPSSVEKFINDKVNSNAKTVLLFTSTWCDWYLEQSRSDMSKNCIRAQKIFNNLSKNNKNVNWHIITNRLWTGEKELSAYKEKYNINAPISIDKSNQVFIKYKVNNFPTLVTFENSKETFRTSNFESLESIKYKVN